MCGDNRLQQQGSVTSGGNMVDRDVAKEFWDGIDQQRRQAQANSGFGLLGQDYTLAGFQPPSAAPREKNLLEQAIRLAEFLKPLEPQARHAVWDIAMSALNNIRRTEDEEARKKQLAEDRHRAALSDNVKRNRVMSLRGAEDAEPDDEDEDD